MTAVSNFKNLFALPLLFAATALTAQNEIQSTQTDEKHGNMTVVYTKNSKVNDADILKQLDDSYGIGDVVRITVAPPKQATSEMVASNDPAVMFAAPKSVPATTPKPVVKSTPKKVEMPAIVEVKKVAKPVAAPKAEPAAVKSMKKGVIYRLDKLYFDVNKFELKNESDEELNRLYEFMVHFPNAVIEIRGHTNNLMWPNADFASELSTNRAKAVADWLVAKGIAANRVQHKGFGWTMPVEPNINAEGRKKNQRVEVKVLSL